MSYLRLLLAAITDITDLIVTRAVSAIAELLVYYSNTTSRVLNTIKVG